VLPPYLCRGEAGGKEECVYVCSEYLLEEGVCVRRMYVCVCRMCASGKNVCQQNMCVRKTWVSEEGVCVRRTYVRVFRMSASGECVCLKNVCVRKTCES